MTSQEIDRFFRNHPPISTIQVCKKNGVEVWMKRLDKIHPQISGNKWFKLWHNLIEARKQNHTQLLTFGGAYSNHLVAIANAGQKLNFTTIGIVRGEETLPLNPVLQYVKSLGMRIEYMSRGEYRQKNSSEILSALQERFAPFYLIPEGGTNTLALQGCAEILNDFEKTAFDFISLPIGTVGTLAGILSSLKKNNQLIGFSSLKGGGFLRAEVEALLSTSTPTWQLALDYHFGGFAKYPEELSKFVEWFEQAFKIKLDPIYTAKMLYGIFDWIEKDRFPRGSKILTIHTGGLPELC